MGEATKIEWATHTFNPWWGCTKVSPGCKNCYAESFDKRVGGHHWGQGAPRRTFGDKHWAQPLKWDAEAKASGKPTRVFCASMADVFDAEAPTGALERLWGLIQATPNLTWMLLTKRPERIRGSLPPDWGAGYANVWLGTSVENQEAASQRIPYLLAAPARVRFLSCEPLLGPVKLTDVTHDGIGRNALRVRADCDNGLGGLGPEQHVDWVIVGGESGHHARPMETDWVRSLRDQCVHADVAFFFKQWGEFLPVSQDHDPMDREGPGLTNIDPATGKGDAWHRVGKKEAGRLLDGRLWNEFPDHGRSGSATKVFSEENAL